MKEKELNISVDDLESPAPNEPIVQIKAKDGISQQNKPPQSCVSNIANHSQSRKSWADGGSPSLLPAEKHSPDAGAEEGKQNRFTSVDDKQRLPTLDFFHQGISRVSQFGDQAPPIGNDQTFDPKTQEIEFVEDEIKSVESHRHDEASQSAKSVAGMQLANAEEVGYQSGPENLEHTVEPVNFNEELIGKKRCRRRTRRPKGEEPVVRKKNAITKCPHVD